jgi:NDP-sugar pyrophosphorylase family protein
VASPPVHALVLAAGLGERLRPLTLARAKPAIPVAGEPLVRRILRWLRANGVIDVVLNLHYLPETVTAVLGDGTDLGVRVRYSWEQPVILGSAGGPRLALPIVGADTFFIVNGDTLCDVDLAALAARHAESGARVTLAVTANREPDRYGGVRVDASGAVVGFTKRGSREPSHHFVGVQIVQAGVFSSIPPSIPASSVGGVYDQLGREQPGSVRAFVCHAQFRDIGTPDDYFATSWALIDAERRGDVVAGRNTQIANSARVTRSILWDDVEVAVDSLLDECIVTDGVRVPAGATHRRAMLVRPRAEDSSRLPMVVPLP